MGGFLRPAAIAGFNYNDTGSNASVMYAELPGSETDAVKNLTITSNVGRPGVWVFSVNEAKIKGKLHHKLYCGICTSPIILFQVQNLL